MEESDNTGQTIRFRVLVAILFGLVGFGVNFLDFELFQFPYFKISILAGLLFPLLIAMAWGWRYGLLSALAGGCQTMWWLWRTDGYGFFYAVPVFTLWVVWHGYWTERRWKIDQSRWYHSAFAVEIPFRIASEFGFYTIFRWLVSLNPPPWNPSITWNHVPLGWVNTVAVKHAITAYLLLLFAHVILSLAPVRRFFGLKRLPEERQISVIYTTALLTGFLLWTVDSVVDFFAFNPQGLTFWEVAILDISSQKLFVRNMYVIFSVIGGALIAHYMARRILVEEALRESEERYRNLSEELTLGMAEVFDALEEISSGNPEVKIPETSGLELITELKHAVNTTAENLKEIVDLSHDFAIGLAQHFDVLTRVSKGDLNARVSGSSPVELLESLEKVTNHMIKSVSREIDERKRAEKRLEKMNSCFLEFGPDPIENINLLTKLSGELLGAACALYNRLEGGLLCSLGQWNTPPDYNPKDKPEGHICYDVIQKGEDDVMVIQDLPNTPYAKTDPNVIPYELQTYIGKPVKCGGKPVGSLCVVFQKDVVPSREDKKILEIAASAIGVEEERRQAEEKEKKLEAQLQRAEKMETVGTLAGGVAHDLNNILSGLVSYPELLLMELPEDSPLRKPILTIQSSGQKAAAIVEDLLTLARRGVVVSEVSSLNDIISDYLQSPEHERLISFHQGVEIEANLEQDLLNVLVSPTHLSKTVMNLVSNAAEALHNGGKVIVSTRNQYIDRPIRGYDEVKEGDYVVLTVADNGVGIPTEDLERIFEPFYTKKVMGRSGTGLGMAVVWGTVKDHKGYIDVESTEGKGTTFELYFPVTRKELEKEKAPTSMEEFMGNGETILIVDDVQEQIEIASMLLTKLGYSVNAVSSGEEAVEYVKTNSADLLVLDMIMDPGIDGLDTYKRIVELYPQQKAIIASGFSETPRVEQAQKLGAGQYIKKPYTLEKVGVAVKTELAK